MAINGYENVYGVNNGTKIYDMLDFGSLYHQGGQYINDVLIKQKQGIENPYLWFYGLVEQTVEGGIYQDVKESYDVLTSFTGELNKYQNKKTQEIADRNEIRDLQAEADKLASSIQYGTRDVKNMSEESANTFADNLRKHAELTAKIKRLSANNASVKKDTVIQSMRDLISVSKTCDELIKRIDVSIGKLEGDREKLVQAFVDSCLLIGQDKLENNVRSCGYALFEATILELMNMKNKCVIIKAAATKCNSSAHLETLDISTDLPIDTEIIQMIDNVVSWTGNHGIVNLFVSEENSEFATQAIGELIKFLTGNRAEISSSEVIELWKNCGGKMGSSSFGSLSGETSPVLNGVDRFVPEITSRISEHVQTKGSQSNPQNQGGAGNPENDDEFSLS